MNPEDRISISNEQMLLSLDAAMDRLKGLRYDAGVRRYLGDRFVEKLGDWETQIRRRREEPFTLAVIGDFKRGKSTFINALLGEEVVTSDVTTETVTLNRIRYGVHSNEALLSGTRRARLEDSELKREELEQVLEELGEPVTTLELKRPIDILKKITIIDTPGTGDAMRDFSDVVKDSLLQADAVVYLYNVRYPLSLSEQLFLRSAVLPQKHTALFLIGNFADTLANETEYSRLRALLCRRVTSLLPNEEVYMLSALDELSRRLGETRPASPLTATLEEQFAAVRERLEMLIESKADTVVVDRMQRLTAAMVADLSAELDAIKRGLSMTEGERLESMEKLRREKEDCASQLDRLLRVVDERVESMRLEAVRWMGDFVDRMVAESADLSEEQSDTIRQYYELFCIDKVQSALNTCLVCHQDRLYDWLDSVFADQGEKVSTEFVQIPEDSFRFHLDNRIWTKGDTVGLVLSMLPSTGLLSTVALMAADGIAGFFREREADRRTDTMVAQITGKALTLHISVNETVNSLYSSLSTRVKKLVSAFWNEKLENREMLLQESIRVSVGEADEKERVRVAAQEARVVLNEVLEKIWA